MEKVKTFFDNLPKELRVLPYVVVSGALTALVKHLEVTRVNDLVAMAIINIVIVLLKERIPQVAQRLKK